MFPRWLSWLVFALLAYIIVQGNRTAHRDLPTATPSVTAEQVSAPTTPETAASVKQEPTPAFDKATDLERWKRAINPSYAKRVQCELPASPSDKPKLAWKVTEDALGSGAAAQCSDTIALKLTVWNPRGEAAYQGETQLMLGAREVAAGLDAALIGIRVGGARTVILSGEALEHDKKSSAAKPLLAALSGGRVTIVTAERLH